MQIIPALFLLTVGRTAVRIGAGDRSPLSSPDEIDAALSADVKVVPSPSHPMQHSLRMIRPLCDDVRCIQMLVVSCVSSKRTRLKSLKVSQYPC